MKEGRNIPKMKQTPTTTDKLQWKGRDAMDQAYVPSKEIQIILLTAHQEIFSVFQLNKMILPDNFLSSDTLFSIF